MAKIQVAAVFSDNMVLQTDKNINIFGWISWDENDKDFFVKAQLFNDKGDLLVENIGIFTPFEGLGEHTSNTSKWVVALSPQTAQDGCTLKINLNNQ